MQTKEMKRTLLVVATAVALYSCNGGRHASGQAGATITAVSSPVHEASVIGKWHLVDMHYVADDRIKLPAQDTITAAALKEQMYYEFGTDGIVKTVSKGGPIKADKYKKEGNDIVVTGTEADAWPSTMEIVSLTDKEMTFKLKGQTTTLTMQKM